MATELQEDKASQTGKAEAKRDEVQQRFRRATTLISVQQMLRMLSAQCFRKCVREPQTELDDGERKCIALCMDRYVDSFNLVARAYGRRLQLELQKGIEAEQTPEMI
ncbi:hypothetical protein KR215_007319 [Drosophila sulfurigaster]|nr:hypothetical protein KR215_007319 [Drosophila sulfurigaster]